MRLVGGGPMPLVLLEVRPAQPPGEGGFRLFFFLAQTPPPFRGVEQKWLKVAHRQRRQNFLRKCQIHWFSAPHGQGHSADCLNGSPERYNSCHWMFGDAHFNTHRTHN